MTTIQRFRSDEEFSKLWERTIVKARDLELSDPSILRRRRPPKRIDSGSTPSTFSSPKEYYQKIYFEVADTISGEIVRRFEQKNYEIYSKAEELLQVVGLSFKRILRLSSIILGKTWTIIDSPIS